MTELTRPPASPFDSIKHTDADGDYWLAREMWQPAGYSSWRRFEDLIRTAQEVLKGVSAGQDHIAVNVKSSNTVNGGVRAITDYRCTRYGAYMILSRSDKPELADYFVMQTMFAENFQRGEAVSQEEPDGVSDPDLASVGWYELMTSKGAVEFFANGRPRRFDPEYMPVQRFTVQYKGTAEAEARIEAAAAAEVLKLSEQGIREREDLKREAHAVIRTWVQTPKHVTASGGAPYRGTPGQDGDGGYQSQNR